MAAPILNTFEVLWDVTSCRLINSYRRFEGTYYLHLQDQTVQEKSLAMPAFETAIISYQSARCNVATLATAPKTV